MLLPLLFPLYNFIFINFLKISLMKLYMFIYYLSKCEFNAQITNPAAQKDSQFESRKKQSVANPQQVYKHILDNTIDSSF